MRPRQDAYLDVRFGGTDAWWPTARFWPFAPVPPMGAVDPQPPVASVRFTAAKMLNPERFKGFWKD